VKIFVSLALAVLLAACVPISSKEMAPMPQLYQQISADTGLQKSIRLGDVRVGTDGVLHASSYNPVKQEHYQEALNAALASASLAAANPAEAKYMLDANLVSLDTPFKLFSLSVTVNSEARYRLRRTSDNFIVWEETLKLPYTAKFSEAMNAEARFRLANANAIRENITHLIRLISSKTESELAQKGI